MAASHVCQSKEALKDACHEYDQDVQMAVRVKDLKWKDASADILRLTIISIKLFLIALCIMICLGRLYIYEAVASIDRNGTKLASV